MAHDTMLLSRHKLSQRSRERLMDTEGSLYTSVLNEQCKYSLWLSSGAIVGFQPSGGAQPYTQIWAIVTERKVSSFKSWML